MTEPVRVAAFDFDGTLTTRDTVGGFALRVARANRAATQRRLARHSVGLSAAIARRDRDRLRAVATRVVFTGVPIELVTAVAEVYAADIIAHRLRDSTLQQLRAQQKDGATTVIVSASYRDYLVPVAAHLGIDSVISTELEVVDGVCTGELVGGNCRGPAKVRRLDAWMSGRGIERRDVDLWAYGDSSGDREMLAGADHPRWVGTRSNSL